MNVDGLVAFNPRYFWGEAEVLIYRKLREGIHPCHLAGILHDAAGYAGWSDYGKFYIMSALMQLESLGNNGAWEGLPDSHTYLGIFSAFGDAPTPELMAFESMMQSRFDDFAKLRWFALDMSMERELGK